MHRPPREITADLIADAIALLEKHPPEAVARRLSISKHVVRIVARQARDLKWRERVDPQSVPQRFSADGVPAREALVPSLTSAGGDTAFFDWPKIKTTIQRNERLMAR